MFNDLGDRESDFNIPEPGEMVRFQPNSNLMARTARREQDLKPQRIFFMKNMSKEEETITAFTEAEAANLLKSSHKFMYRIIGCSDGRAYQDFIKSKGLKPNQRILKTEAEQILRDAWNAELEAARGHVEMPLDQNVHFDSSFPLNQRAGFVPPP